MKAATLSFIMVLTLFILSCKEKECLDVDPMSIQCGTNPTNQVEQAKSLIVGKWNWLEEGPDLNGAPLKTPCNQKLHKVAEFTAGGKLYIYYNSTLAEKYTYRILRANQLISNVPEDTFGVIHLTDYITGNHLHPQFPSVAFFAVCDKNLYMNYTVMYHTKGNEIWSRF